MKNQFYQLLLLGAITLSVSCTKQANDQQLANTAGVDVHTAQQISGQLSVDQSTVRYEVVEKAPSAYLLQVDIDKKRLEALVDYNDQSIDFNGNDNTLTADQMLALNKTSIRIADHIYNLRAQEDATFVISETENTLVRVMDYWSQAPAGYVYGRRQVESPNGRGYNNDGISCIKKGRWYTLKYDGSRGRSSVSKKAGYNGGGSYDCMGRCGAGCGRWWIPSAWTLDCFEHDECSKVYNSSGGTFDSNCGDEFNHAADDWTFGVIRGCSG